MISLSLSLLRCHKASRSFVDAVDVWSVDETWWNWKPQQNRRNCSRLCYQMRFGRTHIIITDELRVLLHILLAELRNLRAPSLSLSLSLSLCLCAGAAIKMDCGSWRGDIKTKFVAPWFSAIKWYSRQWNQFRSVHYTIRYDLIWLATIRFAWHLMKTISIEISSSSGAANQKFHRIMQIHVRRRVAFEPFFDSGPLRQLSDTRHITYRIYGPILSSTNHMHIRFLRGATTPQGAIKTKNTICLYGSLG